MCDVLAPKKFVVKFSVCVMYWPKKVFVCNVSVCVMYPIKVIVLNVFFLCM